ncbi:MAG: penicillin-binding protein 1C [Burkholderiaceae bacterium]|nr:penicillin-binding protein 1C [Burkholderiaceae bacterium]
MKNAKLLNTCAAFLGCILLIACLGLPRVARALESFEQVRRAHQASELQALARDGTPIGRIRTDFKQRRAAWLSLEEFSPALLDTLIRTEDQRFFEHAGVDWRAVISSAKSNITGSNIKRGASTLTMQLAGLLQQDLSQRAGGRSVLQKIDQAATALAIERSWTKAQILEAYLNRVPLRGELVGIPAASEVLFGKAPHGLDKTEAAILTALLRGPNASVQRVAQRSCQILSAGATNKAACELLEGTVRLALAADRSNRSFMLAPHLARTAVKNGNLQTSIDAPLQRIASESLKRQVAELERQNVEDGAVLVLDNATGEVLAWVGSTGTLSGASQIDFVTARRQAGSTLKPFLYAQALAEKKLTAASLIDDSPVNLSTAAGLYMPQNYDRQFAGPVSVRMALASSMNIPAVRTAVMVSPERFFQQLKSLGFTLRESGDYFGYSIALGSAEVSLLELTNAYRALANAGQWSAISIVKRSGTSKTTFPAIKKIPVLNPQAAFIVSDILADPTARVHTFGLDSVLNTHSWAAVKTGTSKDMRDNWCIGYSDRYTVGVWVGNATGEAMWDVSGVHGAAPVWSEVMNALHARKPSQAPQAPSGVINTSITFSDGREAARQEWFLEGTQRSHISLAPAARVAIVAPVEGTVIALDPDIPPSRQRVKLISNQRKGVLWRIDNQPVKSAQGNTLWLPQPGKHLITLHDASGAELDRAGIEVRGAFMKVAKK